MTAPDPFGLADYGDEFDAEIREIQNRREASFVFRWGMGGTKAQRDAADEQRANDIKRIREIGVIRQQRAGEV